MQLTPTDRTRVRRLPDRANYDRAFVHGVIDEALSCHVGFAVDGKPFVVPTIHARIDDRLYLHGALSNRMLRALADGLDACVTVTIVDGLVLARSAFHHSMNYRSVMVFGTMATVDDPDEKRAAFDALVEHVVPGRTADARRPDAAEMRKTAVLGMPIVEASGKARTGGPIDDEEDLALPIWAGVIPVTTTFGAPVPDAGVNATVPAYASRYRRP